MKEVYVIVLQDGSTTSIEGMAETSEQALKDAWDLVYERSDAFDKGNPSELLWENNGNPEERCITNGWTADCFTYFILQYTY